MKQALIGLSLQFLACSVISPLARSMLRRAGTEKRRRAELPESVAAAQPA